MRIHIASEIEKLIAARRWEDLKRRVARWTPPETAIILRGLDLVDALALLRILPPPVSAAVLSRMDRERQLMTVAALPREEWRGMLEAMEPDDRTRFLAAVPDQERQAALQLLAERVAESARALLAYPSDSVGRLMTLEYVAVRASWTVDEALAQVRAAGKDAAAVGTIYVTDDHGRLVDMLGLAQFVLAPPAAPVETIMDGIYVALAPTEDRELAVSLMRKYDVAALPIVDAEERMLGVVTVDDALGVAEEEATEDFQKQAGMTPLEEPYLAADAWTLVRKRIPWLAALIAVYVGASGIVSYFEGALAANLLLAAFIPMLMGTGGNVGAQAGTLAVRALATGQMDRAGWRRVLMKELAVGFAIAFVLGALTALIAGYRAGQEVGLVVTLSMVAIVVVANLFGAMLPMALASAGVDPAVAASPMITSFTDLASLTIYLSLAQQLLHL